MESRSDVTGGRELAGVAGAPLPTQRRIARRLARRKAAVAGLAGLGLVAFVAIFAGLIAPHDPLAQDLDSNLAPPFWDGGSMDHPLGTDGLGRDTLSRLMYGARASLTISLAATLLGALLGLVTGSIAGFYRGSVDTLLMRAGDIQLAFPFILLAIAVLGLIPDRKPIHLILVLGLPGWIVYARVVRSRVLAERDKEYVLAAGALGASRPRILMRYVLPSTWHVIPVIALLDLGFLVIVEATLSFLGFGLTPPTPSWGSTLADGRQYMVVTPWLAILPGFAIMFTVLCINLAADGLADILDPKLTKGTFRRQVLRLPGRRDGAEENDGAAFPLLRVRGLFVEFPLGDRVIQAIRGISFDVERGKTLGIVGESGSGKSVTALSIIQLLDAPGRVSDGTLSFDGRDLARIDDGEMAALRGRRIGMIFQNPASALNPVLTVGFQLTETLRQQLGLSKAEARARTRETLLSVGIGDPERVLRRYPFQLSGGMNQRVMIAMAMACDPDLLIADEPTTALDVTTQAQILEQLREVTRQAHASVILITHDIALVAEYADTIVVMYAGRVCEIGPVADVVEAPKHPYTQALLKAMPRAEAAGDRLEAIPGELPDPATPPPGCPFAPRCPHVMDVCRDIDPDPLRVGPDHVAACHLWAPARAEATAG